MTRARREPRVISAWRRRSLKMNNVVDKQRRALGKGLAALLPVRAGAATAAGTAPAVAVAPSKLPIELIHPNPLQPRVVIQADRLEELAASNRANGIIQPL